MSWSAYKYLDGKAIKLGAPWSEKKMNILSSWVVYKTLPEPTPFI